MAGFGEDSEATRRAGRIGPLKRRLQAEMTMTTLISMTPYVASALGTALLMRAAHMYSKPKAHTATNANQRRMFLFATILLAPTIAQAQTGVDLRTAAESGNAIIMYLSGTLAAIGIVAAGVSMMMGRQAIAKWAFAGAMISGLAFAIVRTMWSNMGLEAAGVSSFAP
ncbi:MAG: hypothetical protein QM760_21030 [Nibricoccus sp.]